MPIEWNTSSDIPAYDCLGLLELDCPYDLMSAIDRFLFAMERDYFRAYEGFMRREQGCPTLMTLDTLADEAMDLVDGFQQECDYELVESSGHVPWYTYLQRLAPHLLRDWRNGVGAIQDAAIELGIANSWVDLARAVYQHARGLSLPAGVRWPLDVVPDELRHRLWIQSCCCDALFHGGVPPELQYADPYRCDTFLDLLATHLDSVAFLDLTLDKLRDTCGPPPAEWDKVGREMSDRLGLNGPDDRLAPKLEALPRQAAFEGDYAQLSEDAVRNAIRHPEPAVHQTAIEYFDHPHLRDGATARTIFESIREMDDIFHKVRACEHLAQFEAPADVTQQVLEEIARLSEALAEDDGDDPRVEYSVCLTGILLRADMAIVEDQVGRMREELPEFWLAFWDEVTEAKAGMLGMSDSDRWAQFNSECASLAEVMAEEDEYPAPPDVSWPEELVSEMEDHSLPLNWIRENLDRTVDADGYSECNEFIAIRLAGVFRFQPAVPYLVALLYEDDWHLYPPAVESLIQIGGDAIVQELADRFDDGGALFQQNAAAVLQGITTDFSVRVLLSWVESADEADVACRVHAALLAQFVTSEIEQAIGWLADGEPEDPMLAVQLRRVVAGAGIACGRGVDEFLLEEVRADFANEADWDEDDEGDWNTDDWAEDDWDSGERSWGDSGRRGDGQPDDLPTSAYSSLRDLSKLGVIPVNPTFSNMPDVERLDDVEDEDQYEPVKPFQNEGPRYGRNDPCPCGSGKKYKKCCLRK